MLFLLTMRVSEGKVAMATRECAYTVGDVWRLACAPENEANKYCLIDGELLVTMSSGQLHGRLALRIGRFIADYADKYNLGETAVEAGYHPPDVQHTVLIPDVAFESRARASQPAIAGYAPYMPDLAVEIISPSQSLVEAKRKAKVYLSHRTAMVWLVHPEKKNAEIWTAGADGTLQGETIDLDGELSAGPVLPGFTLPLRANSNALECAHVHQHLQVHLVCVFVLVYLSAPLTELETSNTDLDDDVAQTDAVYRSNFQAIKELKT